MVCFIRMCGSTTALRGNTAALRHQPNRVPGTLFALHFRHVFPNGVRNTLSVTIRVLRKIQVHQQLSGKGLIAKM